MEIENERLRGLERDLERDLEKGLERVLKRVLKHGSLEFRILKNEIHTPYMQCYNTRLVFLFLLILRFKGAL